ncbi:DNA cytosine methyltransferase [Bacillus wiedmannii]|uniref:Cytosine-specific methyltransferase n=1 Tax=Bacillus wiedmannii TaxID=1890302 RepID=A0A1C4AN30_9BACI|nr:DNA cytosine methyltransferase [Bacillus wiedmannii]PRT36577.1 DNA cytosine methyltransferase [Bacillus wiedmannii]PRT47409.1 DNA cytosine methyltransferase [Bacillus wiedmannii]SCB95938.1 Cytosine-specific methyltransferase [Bacillus wiedmannii]
MINQKLNVLDLFCGCGGLSQGFLDAGYNVVLGVDFDQAALETYKYNHKESEALLADLSADSAMEEIANKIGDKNIDVIIGGPPCQGFSLTGSRDINDTRNTLYLAVVKAVRKFKPKVFLIENVPGIATLYGGKVKQQIVNTFEDMGYNVSVSPKPLLAADFGVPQMRKRMFFVGFQRELGNFKFPNPTHDIGDYVTCEDAISDLPGREEDFGQEVDEYSMDPQSLYQEYMRASSEKLYNHVSTRHTDHVKWVISQVPEGGNHKDLPPGVGDSRKFNEAWTRYHSQKPSRTIDTGHRNHFHYKYNRVPTIRENARLQSFRDDFIFLGTKTQQNRQVGNAVPPLLSFHLAKAIQQHFKSFANEGEKLKSQGQLTFEFN